MNFTNKRILSLSTAAVMALSLTACGGSQSTANTTAGTTSANTAEATSTAKDDATTTADTSAGTSTTDTGNGEPVTLSLYWWGNQTRNDVTKKAVDLYMSQNPNVTIKIEFTDWTGYWDKLSTTAAGGNMPDIIQQDYSYLSQYQKSGQLADLSEFIENGTIDTSKIPESIIESGSIDGKCYAISLGSNAPMMVYDKALAEEAGVTIPAQATIDELYDICQQIYEKTGVYSFFSDGMTMLQMTARANNSHIFDELAAGDSTSSLEYFNNIAKFADSEFFIPLDLLAEKGANVVETRPIIDNTTWNDFSFSNLLGSFTTSANRELGITMYPLTNDSGNQAMFLKPSMFFSIAETSPHKEEAAKFINWFTNSIECNEILLGERGIPVNTEVAEAIKPKVDEVSQIVFDYVAEVGKTATPIDAPDPAGKGEVDTLLLTTIDNLLYGDITPEEAAETFVSESKRILEEAAK